MLTKQRLQALEHPRSPKFQYKANYQIWGLYKTITDRNLNTIVKSSKSISNKRVDQALLNINRFVMLFWWINPSMFLSCNNQSQILGHAYYEYYNTDLNQIKEKIAAQLFKLSPSDINALTISLEQESFVDGFNGITITSNNDLNPRQQKLMVLLHCYLEVSDHFNDNSGARFQTALDIFCKQVKQDNYEALCAKSTEFHMLKEFVQENHLYSALCLTMSAVVAALMFPNIVLFTLLISACINLTIALLSSCITPQFKRALDELENVLVPAETGFIPRTRMSY